MFFVRSTLLKLFIKMKELCGTPETYVLCPAADGWGNAIDVYSERARRYSLSGALSRAVTELKDPIEDHKRLSKMIDDKSAAKRRYATEELKRRMDAARILYGYGWSVLNDASYEVAGNGLWEPKDFQPAMEVVERARLRVCEELGIAVRETGLGCARINDPFRLEEVELLEAIDDAGSAGAILENGDELLAAYDLHRRGLIVPVEGVAWAYRRR